MLVAISMFYHMPDYEQLTKIQYWTVFYRVYLQETRYVEFISILIFHMGKNTLLGYTCNVLIKVKSIL